MHEWVGDLFYQQTTLKNKSLILNEQEATKESSK